MTNTAYDIEKRRADQNWELYTLALKNSENKLKREREAAAGLRSEILKISIRLRAHGGAAEIADSLEMAVDLYRQAAL